MAMEESENLNFSLTSFAVLPRNAATTSFVVALSMIELESTAYKKNSVSEPNNVGSFVASVAVCSIEHFLILV